MSATKEDIYACLRTEIDRREDWKQKFSAYQQTIMHRYAKRISARHKNPEFSLKEASK